MRRHPLLWFLVPIFGIGGIIIGYENVSGRDYQVVTIPIVTPGPVLHNEQGPALSGGDIPSGGPIVVGPH